MAKLALNDCLHTQIFRKVVRLLQTNPVLHRTIRPTSWFVWDGRADMKDDPFIQNMLPAIRLTPTALPARPLTNVRFEAQFLIRMEIGVSGLHMDDIMNLWFAVHYALFPGDGSKVALAALQSLSQSITYVGQNVISLGLGTPAFTPRADAVGSEMLVADGDIWIGMTVPR